MIRVLVVDDEEPIRKWLSYCISRTEEFSCITASNASEGIEKARLEFPEIVISDIEMPGMNGLSMISEILKDDPNIYPIVLTSHEVFDYARTALKQGVSDYILKTEMTEESLLTVLKKAKAELDKNKNDVNQLRSHVNFLQALCLRKEPAEISETELSESGLGFSREPLVAIAVIGGEKEREELFGRLRELDFLGSEIDFSLDKERGIFAANISDDPKLSGAEGVREQLIDLLSEKLKDGDMYSGVSEVCHDHLRLCFMLHEAIYRSRLSFYEPSKRIFAREKEGEVEREARFQPWFVKYISELKYKEAYELLKAYINEVHEAYSADIETIKFRISQMLCSVLYFTEDPVEETDRRAEELRHRVLDADYLHQIERAAEEIFEPFLRRKEENTGVTDPVKRAIDYISEHYSEKITLLEAAEIAGFNHEYFSKVFSRETGVNFVTYINNLRMRHAVELLETTDMKVYEIAEAVGFSSLSYFSTSFKKKIGVNPYEYQVNFQRTQNEVNTKL